VYPRRIRLWDYLRRLNHGRTNNNTVHFRFTNILVLDHLLVKLLTKEVYKNGTEKNKLFGK